MHCYQLAFNKSANKLNTYGHAVSGALPGLGFAVYIVRISQVSYRVSPWQLTLCVLNTAPGPFPYSALPFSAIAVLGSCRSLTYMHT